MVKGALEAPSAPKARKSKRVLKVPSRRKLRTAMMLELKKVAQAERGNKVSGAGVRLKKAADEIPIEQRAGFPLVPTKVHPRDWKTEKDVPIVVDFARVPWLPDDWGQGVKKTLQISRSRPGFGGTYTVWINSEGRVFYHRKPMEELLGRKLTFMDGFNGQRRLAQLQGKQTDEPAFFRLLDTKERRCLPKADDLHFCVISARRATTEEGISDIAVVEGQFSQAKVKPTWYVDAESLEAYKKLGLKAVLGGKLCESRNKALNDAARLGKACVQVSDDIARWEYYDGESAKDHSDDAQNAAFAKTTCHVISPVAAARFLLAKLRALGSRDNKNTPKLAGVYMLSNCARAMFGDTVQRYHFILGDFFVADKSSVRFDETMTLKEDYDYTCQHIATHGSVLRCNRMVIHAKHQRNAGGACSNRDKKGIAEQRNMAILYRKWPRAIRPHHKRRNEVILVWPEKGTGKVKKDPITKGSVAAAAKAPRGAKDLPMDAVVVRGGRMAKAPHIRLRCNAAQGRTVADVLANVYYKDGKGSRRKYAVKDLKYDIGMECLAIAN